MTAQSFEPLPADRNHVAVAAHGGEIGFRLSFPTGRRVEAEIEATPAPDSTIAAAAVALVERLTAEDPHVDVVRIRPGRPEVGEALVQRAAGRPAADGSIDLLPAIVWQLPAGWLGGRGIRPYPALGTVTAGRPHPLRPPKPAGTLYTRWIPWLGKELGFRAATRDDAGLLNRWMNDPRVAEVWAEEGPLEHHRVYLEGLIADPHVLPLVATLDGTPFGWFEVYWAAEDRLGAHYPAEDFDRGWHVAIGAEDCRGRAYVSAWLPSLMHLVFLDDPRTRRIVGEPRADHHQQLRNLERSGFATVGTVDFPHKRAALVMLTRDRFFRDRLWAPGAVEASLTGTPRTA
jgi:acetyl CoA:N6-hydroxylysine acetyl transferase